MVIHGLALRCNQSSIMACLLDRAEDGRERPPTCVILVWASAG